jgi:hypothetical protein
MSIKKAIEELELFIGHECFRDTRNEGSKVNQQLSNLKRIKGYYEMTQTAFQILVDDNPDLPTAGFSSLIEEKAFEFKALISFGEIGEFGETGHLMIKSNIGESPFHDDFDGYYKLAYAQSYTRRIADKISADKNFRVGVYSVNAKINSDRTLIMDSTWAFMEMSATLD